MPKKFGAKCHRDWRNALRGVTEGARIQKRPHMSEAELKREYRVRLKAACESGKLLNSEAERVPVETVTKNKGIK